MGHEEDNLSLFGAARTRLKDVDISLVGLGLSETTSMSREFMKRRDMYELQ
jgi:hypothetical protein